jgi:hypothetical protein
MEWIAEFAFKRYRPTPASLFGRGEHSAISQRRLEYAPPPRNNSHLTFRLGLSTFSASRPFDA